MNFEIEVTDMDLGDTLIENIFINDFMPMANGTFVKVYLLGYKFASEKNVSIKINNQIIAKHLQIPLEDVLAAWDFWEEKGIITKLPIGEEDHEYGVRFKSLKQLYIQNNPKVFKENIEKKSITTNDVLEANQNIMINQMFNNINHLIRRETQITEKMEILKWIQDYNMNPDVIELAFSYAVEERNVRYNHMSYVGKMIVNWYDRDLTNVDAVMGDFQNQNKRYYDYKEILKNIGISTVVTPDIKERIDIWFDEYKMPKDLIIYGCRKSSGTSNPNFNYIDSIITKWHEKGIKTIEEVETLDSKNKAEKTSKSNNYAKARPNNYKNRFHNFKQRTDDYTDEEIEKLARKKREQVFDRFKGE